ncbi:MAG: D-glycerate dehydrogenase [Dethiobacteria bacterium]|nr:D-glycerate dehydrogenase [Bacillota bacterium]HOJ83570.1 D-glycerate dehydrogenase [Bacillota bacterium]HOL16352.1 D-glycerate dehydrogenase [Bacillota bacterium]
MSTIFITREIPDRGLKLLEGKYRLIMNPANRPVTRQEMMEGIKEADALLCLLCDRVDREVIESAPKLKLVANMAVGVDNIDIEACTGRGIVVTNTPGVLTEATADLTWALLLAVARRIVEGDRFVREGKFNGWAPLLLVGGDLYGKTLGIIGMGRIGQAVARRAIGFGMNIVYCKRKRLPLHVEQEFRATYMPLDEVIRKADFLTLHLPYSPEVHHLINKERLNLMKPTAYLINTARGAHIDERALVEHLKEYKIAGAALDVYEKEPELTPGLTELENVVLAPHTGSASMNTRSIMAEMAAKSIVQLLSGEKPEHVVNPEVFDKS